MKQRAIPGIDEFVNPKPSDKPEGVGGPKPRLPRLKLTRDRRAADEFDWRLTAHACRACFGRVLMRTTFEGKRVYRCANCGVEREGADERAICTCGLKLKTGRDAGVRCVVNADRSPEMPYEVVAEQADAPIQHPGDA